MVYCTPGIYLLDFRNFQLQTDPRFSCCDKRMFRLCSCVGRNSELLAGSVHLLCQLKHLFCRRTAMKIHKV